MQQVDGMCNNSTATSCCRQQQVDSNKLHVWTGLKMHFFGIPLRECCAKKFLHKLEIDQALIAHTRSGTGVPPPKKNFNRENLKFGLKFSVCTSITSGRMVISSQIFIQTMCRDAGVITWVQFVEGLPPKIWEGKKTSNFFAISDNFRL